MLPADSISAAMVAGPKPTAPRQVSEDVTTQTARGKIFPIAVGAAIMDRSALAFIQRMPLQPPHSSSGLRAWETIGTRGDQRLA